MLLYHEPQVAGLCGVHCINTVLQGPIFTAMDLAQIAQELDAMERALLGGSAEAGEHGNVDASGMFSVQVLSKALEVWGLTTTPLTSPDVPEVAQAPERETAFICNLQEHWFTIRKMPDGSFYNFNSLYPAPEALSPFYLAAYLASLREQGYTIFVVRSASGNWDSAQVRNAAAQGVKGGGRWFSPEEAKALTAEAAAARERGKVTNALETALARAEASGGAMALRSKRKVPDSGQAGNADEEADLEAAIAASLGEGGSEALQGYQEPQQQQQWQMEDGVQGGEDAGPSGMAGVEAGNDDEDFELAAAIAASLAEGGGGSDGGSAAAAAAAAQQAQQQAQQEQHDKERAQAAESLGAEPEPGPGVVELAFRLPGGSRA